MILYSPAERGAIIRHLTRAAATVDIEVSSSQLCEKRGVDFLWRAQGKWWGVQRKELHDLLASFDDGRLSKEIAQIAAVGIELPTLVVEGRIQVDNEGNVATSGWGRGITLEQLRRRELTMALRGVTVLHTANTADTAEMVVTMYLWSQQASHTTGATRPGPKGAWGDPTTREYQEHLLQGLPDVGPKLAAAIVEHFGRCPLVLDVGEKDLREVPGIGKVTAARIVRTAPGGAAREVI